MTEKDYNFDFDQYDNFYDTYDKDDSNNSDNKDSAKDCNGAILQDGDTVQVNKDLKIKGMSKTLKRGTTVNKIKTIGDPEHVECRVGKTTVVLKTC
ncbi:MAG TPA: PhnA protein, partial [Alphaproteobacteria bacterium]|nr:PhnA protein [Alphaproteobacteria bacterium]